MEYQRGVVFDYLYARLADVRAEARDALDHTEEDDVCLDVRIGWLDGTPHFFWGDVSWDAYHCPAVAAGEVYACLGNAELRSVARCMLDDLEEAMAEGV